MSITHHTYKPRHKPLGFSNSLLVSILITLGAQSLNFEFKTKWSTTKMTTNQRQAQKWSSIIREPQNQELLRKQEPTNEKAKKNSTTTITFSMQALPLW
jgi:hypothetical protein